MQKNSFISDPCVANREKREHTRPFLLLLLSLALLLSSCAAGRKQENEGEPSVQKRALTVYVDAGHGGFDMGATAVTETGETVSEKDLTLSVAMLVAEGLRAAGHTVLLSRTGDERLTYTNSRDEILARRAAAVAGGADLLLSIHVNAYAGEGRAFGPRIYYHPESKEAAACAESLATAVTQHTGAVIGRECRVVSDESYLILKDLSLPSVLFEIGFLSDARELSCLLDPAYQKRLADAVCEALA